MGAEIAFGYDASPNYLAKNPQKINFISDSIK